MRNRDAGHKFERDVVTELKKLGYDVSTSRNESRKMDAMKVDIVGNFPYHIQCKNTQNRPDYNSLIGEMPKDKPCLVFHRQTHKANKKFMTDGDFVIMSKETFYNLIK